MKPLALVVLMSLCGCAGARMRPRTGETAATELAEFVAFTKSVHPDPFRFVTEDSLDAIVSEESARLRATAAPTDLEIGRAFEVVVAALHDTHMQVTLPAFQTGHDEDLTLLPFLVALVGDEVFLDAGTTLPIGTTVSAIEGVPIATILSTLSTLAIFEGENDAARRRVIERDFAKLYHLAYGMRAAYEISVHSPDTGDRTLTMAALGHEAFRALDAARHSRAMRGAREDRVPTLDVLDADTRLVRLPSFGVMDTDGYEARIASIVVELQGVPRLVLDLRGNEGGFRTLGIALANHLASGPYAQWRRMGVAVRAIPGAYEDRVEAAFGLSLDVLYSFPRTRTNGLFVREGDPLADRMFSAVPHLTPALVVLVDGLTNSAANELSLALRALRPDATFIGEEVGGECERHVGELPITYTTPTFGVVVLMSLIRVTHVEVPGCVLGHGLAPDVSVSYSRDDFVTGHDPYLSATMQAF